MPNKHQPLQATALISAIALLLANPFSHAKAPQTETQAYTNSKDCSAVLARQGTPKTIPSLSELAYLQNDANCAKQKAQQDPLGYAWDSYFLAIWPAKPGANGRGQPDPNKQAGDTSVPAVFQTWKQDAEVYLDNGAQPAAYHSALPTPPDNPTASGYWTWLNGNLQADGFDLKGPDGKPVRYTIYLNQGTFDYIDQNQLYNVDGQIAFAGKNPSGYQFPWTAMEAKGAWLSIHNTQTQAIQQDRYITSQAFYRNYDRNGRPVAAPNAWVQETVALTGLHISTKAIGPWVWLTFEQKDNESVVGVARKEPIPDAIKASSAQVQKLLAGSRWANYELIGYQIAFDGGQNSNAAAPTQQAKLLANTQIESAFQTRSSCITCHAMAAIKSSKDIQGPTHQSYLDPAATPPYYIGQPPTVTPNYVPMDFVFSLFRAQWQKPAAPQHKQ